MKVFVGIFHSAMAANGVHKALLSAGVTPGHIMLLTPETGSRELHTVSREHPPGSCDVTAGHVMGAATGFAGGLLGSAAVLLLIPGVGPILAVGALVTTALVGATVGATLGGVVQDTFTMTLDPEDVFIYEDALRQGCSLLLVRPVNEKQRNVALSLFTRLSSERVGDLRNRWWRRLRQHEAEIYPGTTADFASHEVSYRRGFEAALDVRTRGRTYDESRQVLTERDPAMYQDDTFRYGFTRGQVYYHDMLERDLSEPPHTVAIVH